MYPTLIGLMFAATVICPYALSFQYHLVTDTCKYHKIAKIINITKIIKITVITKIVKNVGLLYRGHTAYANEVDGVTRCASSFFWLTRSLPRRSLQAFCYWLFSVTSAEKKQLGFSCTVRRLNFRNPRRISCFIPSAKICSEINVLQFLRRKHRLKREYTTLASVLYQCTRQVSSMWNVSTYHF